MILAGMTELVRKDVGYDATLGVWHAPGQMRRKKEGGHTLCSEAREAAVRAGLELIATWFVKDANCGGATQRERVFLVWEEKSG